MRGKLLTEKDFWGKVAIPGDPNSCWRWPGKGGTKGYGGLSFRCKYYGAHRLAYELCYGAFDKNLMVLHLCNVRGCVNPRHLYLGDGKDNMRDAVESKAWGLGENHHRSKLTDQDVVGIKDLLAAGWAQSIIAGLYHISRGAISSINLNETWKHIPASSKRVAHG